VSLLLALSLSMAYAQTPSPADTTPFRSGQWALQFTAGSTFGSLGALRFTSPRKAWLLDLRVDGGHSHNRVTTPTGPAREAFTSWADVTLRVGPRYYAARGNRLVSFAGVGVVGGFTHDAGGEEGGPSAESNGWTAGAFGDLGATYLVLPRLGLGGTATLSAAYSRSTSRTSGGSRARHWDYRITGPALALVATLYF
jgi:hypothetical protein